jgi:hypothetical protein
MTSADEILNVLERIYARLGEVSDYLVDINDTLTDRSPAEGTSSLAVEDMAKGDPKITSKSYGTPLSLEQIDDALNAHAYAHRMAASLALDGWQRTLESLRTNGPQQ